MDEAISSVEDATDCTLVEASSEAAATMVVNSWARSAVVVSVPAAASSWLDADDTVSEWHYRLGKIYANRSNQSGAATELDPNRPIWDTDHLYIDAGVSYSTRMYHDKWRVRFQLNVRNLQENGRLQKIGAYPDGRGHTFRIVDPRQFIFTTGIDL